jgi:uncharacterized protein
VPGPDYVGSLGLVPHPEGGWYRSYYRSPVVVEHPAAQAPRPTATLIHFLLRAGERSRWHVVRSDEIWLWQGGGALTLTTSEPGGRPGAGSAVRLGPDLAAGEVLQALVPAGWWQRAEPAGQREALVSCMVTPGFDFADFMLLEDGIDQR